MTRHLARPMSDVQLHVYVNYRLVHSVQDTIAAIPLAFRHIGSRVHARRGGRAVVSRSCSCIEVVCSHQQLQCRLGLDFELEEGVVGCRDEGAVAG